MNVWIVNLQTTSDITKTIDYPLNKKTLKEEIEGLKVTANEMSEFWEEVKIDCQKMVKE